MHTAESKRDLEFRCAIDESCQVCKQPQQRRNEAKGSAGQVKEMSCEMTVSAHL